MLSYSIAMPSTISRAIMNVASSTSTAKEFTENADNMVTAMAAEQQQQIKALNEGGTRSK